MRRRKIKASIILPTYNEAGNIIKLVEDVERHLSEKRIEAEIVIIDDDSSDKTGLLSQKYFSKVPQVRVIIRKKERGLASAIRDGIEVSVGDIIVVMDTDFNHEPKLVPRLIEKCEKYDFVVGSRFVRGGGMANKKREWLSKLFNIFIVRPIINSPVHDNLSGFFAVKREVLDKVNFKEVFFGYGDYFIRLIHFVSKNRSSFTEVPSFYREREYGESKSQFLKMFRDYFLSSLYVRFGKNLNAS